MAEKAPLTHEMALAELKRHGIENEQVYLVDIIPLIEMAWADGKIQKEELQVLDHHLVQHVKRINAHYNREILNLEMARKFVKRFLVIKPDPGLLRTLRSLIMPARKSSGEQTSVLTKSMLAACLDIAAAAPTGKTPGLHDRFGLAEKLCLFQMLDDLKDS